MRSLIDKEVKCMTEEAYECAKDVVRKHFKEHHLLAKTLLEYEALTGDEVRAWSSQVKSRRGPSLKERWQMKETKFHDWY